MLSHISKKIVLVGTGGTIAGSAARADDNLGYRAGQLGVEQLLAAIPGAACGPCEVVTEQLAQLDSKDMSFAVWRQLALRCAHWLGRDEVQGVIITHGTDTLEETAFFLQSVLPVELLSGKPLVLTCAMRPASARVPDGPQNLSDAFALALDARARGVMAVCAGRIHGAAQVQKVHPYRLDAFDSGDAGPMGFIEEGLVRWVNPPVCSESVPVQPAGARGRVICGVEPEVTLLEWLQLSTRWPRVEIVMNYAGASGSMVDAMLAHASHDPLRGLVVAATGNGSLHQDLEAALLRAQAAGIRVLLATRCAYGRVLPRTDAAFPDSCGLAPVKARVALLLELALAKPQPR